jgi:hypothetical protein
LAISRGLKDVFLEATTLENLATLAAVQGDFLTARTHHLAALTILVAVDTKYDALWCLVNCARVEQKLGNSLVALKVIGATEEHLARLTLEFPEHHTKVLSEVAETATKVVDESEATWLRDQGRTLSLADILELLKAQTDPVKNRVLARAEV